MSVIYPICYKGKAWNSIPSTCGPGNGQTYAQFGFGKDREGITGWAGSYPLTWEQTIRSEDYYQGPPITGMGGSPASTTPRGPGFFDNLKLFFEAGNRATDAAKVVGYATIAVVGGGLLLWYVPRKKQ